MTKYRILHGLVLCFILALSTAAQAQAPDAPAAPTFSDVRAASFTVHWTAPNQGGSEIIGYTVNWRKTGTDPHQSPGQIDLLPFQARIFGLDTDTTYDVRVRARNSSDGDGPYSDWASVTATGGPEPAPHAPHRPTLVSADQSSIEIAWSVQPKLGVPIASYDLEFRTNSAQGVFVDAGHTGTERTHTFNNLDANTGYEFRVRARSDSGPGDWSPSAVFTTASEPGSEPNPDPDTSSPEPDPGATPVIKPKFSVEDAAIQERPGAELTFNVRLDRAASRQTSIIYSSFDGTPAHAYASRYDGVALEYDDYRGVYGTLVFEPGETLKTVAVPVLVDYIDEGVEFMQLFIWGATGGASYGDTAAIGAIADPDPPLAQPEASAVRNLMLTGTTSNSLAVTWNPPAEPANPYYVVKIRRDDADARATRRGPEHGFLTLWFGGFPDGAWYRPADIAPQGVTSYTFSGLPAGRNYEIGATACTNHDFSLCGPVQTVTARTHSNSPPVFDQDNYHFTLARNVDGSTTPVSVGTVAATDPDAGDTVRYEFALVFDYDGGGDASDKFAIDSATGAITYVGSGEESDLTFALQTRARDPYDDDYTVVWVRVADNTDESGGADPETEESRVADAALTNPGAVQNLLLTQATATSLTMTWEAPAELGTGDDPYYFVQIRESGADGYETGGEPQRGLAEHTFSGLEPETSYVIGVTACALPSPLLCGPFEGVAADTLANDPNNLPVFGQASYLFTLAENADGSTIPVSVGTVAATDEDAGDAVRYEITSAVDIVNADARSKFLIDSTGGAITYVGSGEDFEAHGDLAPLFVLAVSASDGVAETYAVVWVAVDDVDESADDTTAAPASPIAGFTLVDGSDGSAIGALADGATVAAADFGRLEVRADIAAGESVGSVYFVLAGPETAVRTENFAPWELYGGRGSQEFPPGQYQLTATPYPESGLGGEALPALSVSFTVSGRRPALSVADAQGPEGGTLEFRVTLDSASSGPVTVAYTTADGTATEGEDYEPVSGTLTFTAGETDKTVAVNALADAAVESTETLGLRLSALTGATSARSAATGRIEDATPVGPPPFAAQFLDVPPEHDGSSRFTFELRFDSEPEELSFRTVRDSVLEVTGGTVRRAKRVTKGSNLAFRIHIEPAGLGAVTVALGSEFQCGASVCALVNDATATIPGPASLSVADAEGYEGEGAVLEFRITLSRQRHEVTTVNYATADGTAEAGADYTAASGTLTFAAGETAKTVSVALLDDAHDEGSETLTLMLSNASGAHIADGEATGTIINTDNMPRAWTARFGRSVAVHVLDAVEARLEGATESWAQLGGHRLGVTGTGMAASHLAPRNDLWVAPDTPAQDMTVRQLLLGSAFHLVSNPEDEATGPRLGAWGRVAASGFDGQEDQVSLDGTVTTATLGVDGTWKRWLSGLVLAYSEGEGSYTHVGMPGGDLSSSLTSVHPYVAYTLSDRVRLWGLVGYGSGSLQLRLAEGGVMDTDLTMTMGALGVRGTLLQPAQPGGMELALRSDALWMVMDSAAADNLAATEADASRLRLVLEGSRPVALAGGGSFTPALEVGLRHDGGDADTGSGLEVGGSLRYASAWGLSIEASVRGLLAHEAQDYQEWGASGALRFDPGRQGRGLTAALVPAWGTAASGVSRLWDQPGTTGLPGTDPLASSAAGRLDAELGYGLAALNGRGLLTPYARVALSEGADQAWHLGTRLALAESLNLSVEASRRQREDDVTAHELALRANMGW